jgi:hypothetical protein
VTLERLALLGIQIIVRAAGQAGRGRFAFGWDRAAPSAAWGRKSVPGGHGAGVAKELGVAGGARGPKRLGRCGRRRLGRTELTAVGLDRERLAAIGG